MKKKLTILLAIAMMATMMTACGSSDSTTDDTSSADNNTVATEAVTDEDVDTEADTETEADADAEADETEADETEAADVIVLPDGVAAEDGDAYLAYGDAEWWLQYGGNDMDNLSFGAEVVHIDGDGTYTVSLDASNPDAVGMNGLDTITGCSFCAIVIKNGEELFPDQATAITIDSITLDGNEVEFTKNYCNYEDGNLRTNIFNSYVTQAPTEDVWTADGDLDGISAQIVPASTFDTAFSKIEVTFTISSTGATAEDDSDSDAEADSDVADDSAEADSEADSVEAEDAE
jgi:predicted  nucleic acid-binding Zn-ribbon protein